MTLRLVAHIAGRVQGVGYRYWTRRQAIRLGITGWIRNNEDERSVELLAEGSEEALTELERLLRAGPPGSRVEHVEVRRGPASGEYERFEITRS